MERSGRSWSPRPPLPEPAPFCSNRDAGKRKRSEPYFEGGENWGGRNGIEPSSPGWSPGALPWLCYSRIRIVSTDAPRYCMVVLLSTFSSRPREHQRDVVRLFIVADPCVD